MPPPSPRPRARDLGVTFGPIPTGAHNAITDVPGVKVGHVTLWADDGPVGRTGVTAVVPAPPFDLFHRPMAAGTAVLNGAGELTGSVEVREWGVLETPIMLTGTNAVGRVYDGVVDSMIHSGVTDVVIPVVGECDDSGLDDITARRVNAGHAVEAIADASGGPVAEGVVGAGTGMVAMGYKAGIGTSSRIIDGLGTVGVLLLCNFGGAELLRLGGARVGARLAAERAHERLPRDDGGSCIGVVMTDIPLDARQLERVARRVGLGLARVGSVAHHGSGEIFCAVSTTNRLDREATNLVDRRLLADGGLDPVFTAVVDATEEAVTNALFVADAVTGVGGAVPGLPVEQVMTMITSEGSFQNRPTRE